jgi:hypothetical protein
LMSFSNCFCSLTSLSLFFCCEKAENAVKTHRTTKTFFVTDKRKKLGKLLIEKIIYDGLQLNENQGCKLITVDAYQQSLGFYEKIGFQYLTEEDKNDDTRQMFFDLSAL